MISKKLLAEKLVYGVWCVIKKMRKLDKWWIKEEVAGLKKTIHSRRKGSESDVHLYVTHLLFTEASSEMVSMEGWLSISHS